jgi:hypothetical protein
MKGRFVYDGRNILSREQIEGAGLVYHGVGRPMNGHALSGTSLSAAGRSAYAPLVIS